MRNKTTRWSWIGSGNTGQCMSSAQLNKTMCTWVKSNSSKFTTPKNSYGAAIKIIAIKTPDP